MQKFWRSYAILNTSFVGRYNIGCEIMHAFLVLSGIFCVLMISKKMFVSPFVFVSVGARCESTFSTGVREGVAGWGEYQAIPIIIEMVLWLQVRMAKVHTPPMMLYCYCRNQGCAIAPRACTHLESPWKSLNFKIKIQGLESPWKLQSMLESSWISMLT